MKVSFTLLALLFLTFSSAAQSENVQVEDSIELVPPQKLCECIDFPDDEVSSFPGGNDAWKQWLSENIVYPEISLQLGEQGRVYVAFVIETDGSITNAEVMSGVSPELDREALRLVRSMPKWSPASIKGNLVRSRCRVAINFALK